PLIFSGTFDVKPGRRRSSVSEVCLKFVRVACLIKINNTKCMVNDGILIGGYACLCANAFHNHDSAVEFASDIFIHERFFRLSRTALNRTFALPVAFPVAKDIHWETSFRSGCLCLYHVADHATRNEQNCYYYFHGIKWFVL